MEDGMDMEGEKDMNRKCVKQNVVVNVMRKIIMVMKQVRFQVDDDKKQIAGTVFLRAHRPWHRRVSQTPLRTLAQKRL